MEDGSARKRETLPAYATTSKLPADAVQFILHKREPGVTGAHDQHPHNGKHNVTVTQL
jgi:hypothetical protein